MDVDLIGLTLSFDVPSEATVNNAQRTLQSILNAGKRSAMFISNAVHLLMIVVSIRRPGSCDPAERQITTTPAANISKPSTKDLVKSFSSKRRYSLSIYAWQLLMASCSIVWVFPITLPPDAVHRLSCAMWTSDLQVS